MIKELKEVQSINIYYSVYDLLEERTTCEFWNALSEDDKGFLHGLDDYEGFTYFVINHELVMITIDGSTVIESLSLESLIQETIERLNEDREERE